MSRPTPRHLPVRPGPQGVADLAAGLRRMLDGDARPLAVAPAIDPSQASAQHAAALAAALREDAPIEHDDVALIVATSGSVGEPVGVLLSRSALLSAADLGTAQLGGPGLWLTAVPVTGVGGLLSVLRSVLAGFDPVALPGVGGADRFTPDLFAGAADRVLHQARAAGAPAYVSLVPTQWRRVLADDGTAARLLPRFAAILVGGAAVSAADHEIARSRGIPLVETYGATETCGGVFYNGVALPGVKVTLIDPDSGAPASAGRIVIASSTLALGYRLRPDLTSAAFRPDGFHSLDAGRIIADRLVIDGRLDQIVLVGGVKVSLSAVSNCLLSHPRVIDAVTVALDDPEWGAVPQSFVVTDGTVPDDDGLCAELLTAVASRLGRASRPRVLEFVDRLPATHTGKPIRPAGR